MGLDDVKQEILEQAEQEKQEILEQAHQEKQEILEQAHQEKQEILEQAESTAQQEAEALRKKQVASARMAARKKQQQARQDVLEQVFSRFQEQVGDLDIDEEQELLENVLTALDDRVDIGTVRTADRNRSLAEAYGDVVEEDVRGAIVESADGRQRFDFSFTAMIEKTVNDHRKDVAEVLFE